MCRQATLYKLISWLIRSCRKTVIPKNLNKGEVSCYEKKPKCIQNNMYSTFVVYCSFEKGQANVFGKLLYVYINEHRMQIKTSFRKFSHLTTDRNEKRKPFFRPCIIIQNNNWSIKMLIKTYHTLRVSLNFNCSSNSLIFKYFWNSKYADKKIFCIYI